MLGRTAWAFSMVALLAIAASAEGQLFGDRSLGRSLSRRNRPASLDGAGSVDLSARYVRGNRDTSDFVGADVGDRQSFVGMQQGDAAGPVRAATSGLRIETGPDANRAARSTRRRSRMYDPRLRVDFEFGARRSREVSSELSDRLASSLSLSHSSRIEVFLADRTATLRGAVPSERVRNLARLLVLFEPGISRVENELVVQPLPMSPPEDRPTRPTASPGN